MGSVSRSQTLTRWTLPVRHGAGKLVLGSERLLYLERLDNHLIVLTAHSLSKVLCVWMVDGGDEDDVYDKSKH